MACGEEDINPHWESANLPRTATEIAYMNLDLGTNDWLKRFNRPVPLYEWKTQYIEQPKGEPKMGATEATALMQQVTITPVLNGFTVKIGCKTLVFEKIETLCRELIRYSKNPAAIEKEYLKSEI